MNKYMSPYTITESSTREYIVDLNTYLFKYRIIFVSGEVNMGLAYKVIQQIQYLNMCDPNKEIYMIINSPGGCVVSGLAIIDCMNTVKCPIVTIGVGLVASMGTVLLCAGAPGKRSAYAFTRIMAHQLSAGFEGPISELGIEIKECQALENALYNIISRNSKIGTEQDVRRLCSIDFWMSASEALKLGLIDEIVKPEKSEDCYHYNSEDYSFASKNLSFLINK